MIPTSEHGRGAAGTARRASIAWVWLPPLLVAVVTVLGMAIWGIDSWRHIGPAAALAARYDAAPPCAGDPAPDCRATVPGTIVRAETRATGLRSWTRLLTVQFPGTVRAITMPQLSRVPRDAVYPAFQPGGHVTAEWYGDRVVRLATAATDVSTEDNPDHGLSRARNSRDIAALFVALVLPFVGLFGWLLRRQPRAA